MSSISRRGRPTVPYKTSWGEEVHGLYRCPDGRYRIVATGEKFTEPDERLAVKRFRQWQATHGQEPLKMVAMRVIPEAKLGAGRTDMAMALQKLVELAEGGHLEMTVDRTGPQMTGSIANAPDQILWGWVRHMLLNSPEEVAAKTGIPEIANLRHMPLPRPSLKLTELIDAYTQHSAAREQESKRSAVRALQRLIDFCQVQTLDDLTTEKLLAYRQAIESDPDLPSGDSRKAYFARCKTVIKFGLKVGKDAPQIVAALNRMKVLWSAAPSSGVNPQPISPEDFRHLLSAAEGAWAGWRIWLLLGLNLCLHLKDVCLLRWADIDLAAGTYCTIRRKTEQDRIPQAAILWDETVAELQKLPRTGEFVLNSRHGTHYHRTSRSNGFLEFRKAVGMAHVEFDHLRDGAYTAACRSRADDKWARLLAGHRAEGLQDSYVLRNPEIVRPACEAVYQHYFGDQSTPRKN